MNKPVFENQRELNCKKTIVILSIISLICEVLSFIPYFVACYWVDGKVYYQLVQFASARSYIFVILDIALSIAPRVLLIDYSTILFHKPKANIIVPIIFSSTTIPVLLNFAYVILFDDYRTDGISLITRLIIVVAFTFATISALKGLSNKSFIVIPIILGFVFAILSIIRSIPAYMHRQFSFIELLPRFASIIATITLYAALLFFGLKNRIPVILSGSPEKANPEQALRLLNDELVLGNITDEEYAAQRSRIINEL